MESWPILTCVTERKKISINLQPAVESILDEMCAAESLRYTEAIHEAIKLRHFVKTQLAEGRRLYVVDDTGVDPREIVIL